MTTKSLLLIKLRWTALLPCGGGGEGDDPGDGTDWGEL